MGGGGGGEDPAPSLGPGRHVVHDLLAVIHWDVQDYMVKCRC